MECDCVNLKSIEGEHDYFTMPKLVFLNELRIKGTPRLVLKKAFVIHF